MSTLTSAFQAILRFALFAAFAITAIVGIFVAWWIVVFAALAFGAYMAFMRFFGVGWSDPARKATIKGEFKVEREGRETEVIEVRQEPVSRSVDDKNRL